MGFFYPTKIIGQSGVASRWRVCYQRGLPVQFLLEWCEFQFRKPISKCDKNSFGTKIALNVGKVSEIAALSGHGVW